MFLFPMSFSLAAQFLVEAAAIDCEDKFEGLCRSRLIQALVLLFGLLSTTIIFFIVNNLPDGILSLYI